MLDSKLNNSQLYAAYLARDVRFDGVFYIGVTSTGIYCRPVCSARTPKIENCLFFTNAILAEKAKFRPCLRCRPEIAPRLAAVTKSQRIANAILQNLHQGKYDESNIEDIAQQFTLSSRQIRRIIQTEFGVSPLKLVTTQRLLLAKQLLTETTLPVTQICYTSGFASLRRFNTVFKLHYTIPPSQLRKSTNDTNNNQVIQNSIELQLPYRPPYDFSKILNFLSTRMLVGIEAIVANTYMRTVQTGGYSGWIVVRNIAAKNIMLVSIATSLLPVLPILLEKVRNIFDLKARPDVIAAKLLEDPMLSDLVLQNPGLRVPGAFDGFELAVRAILGQQITVKAATTLSGRFVSAFGTSIVTPFPDLVALCPTPACIASKSSDEIAKLGIIQSRATSIILLAQQMADNQLQLNCTVNPDLAIKQLVAIKGIGAWTANYIAMRALRCTDAFPAADIVLRNNLGGISATEAESISQQWRPWRSYVVMYLWQKST